MQYAAALAEYDRLRFTAQGSKEQQGALAPAQFAEARRESVTEPPDANRNGLALWTALQSPPVPILPPYGTRRREWALRLYDRHPYNTLWQGAVDGLLMRWCATNWVIDGGKILANRYQRIFRGAVSGEWVGWDSWLASVARDYLRFDGGAWIEVVGGGDPRSELIGGVTGLNHLDSYQTFPTGDPEYPCVYFSRLGKYNLMHRSRVIHLIDMPDGDVYNPGYGLCALSRAIAVVERQILQQRYIAMNLNDVPSSGVVIAENVTPQQVEQAYNAMQQRTQNDMPGQPGNVVWIHALNPAFPADLKNFTFSRPPEKFDWNTYVQIDVNQMALAIGEDPQDLWPLSSGAMGSGMQSEVLAKKGKGKMYGHFLQLLERELNSILPESLEFQFKIVDPDEATKEATVAKTWGEALTVIGARLSLDEGRRLLSDNVEQIQNVVTTEAGEYVELPDYDVRPIDAGGVLPNTNPAPPDRQEQPVAAPDNTPNASATKDLQSTQLDFEGDFDALIESARASDVTRRRFGTIARDLIRKYGDLAYRDGLKDGGVQADLDANDRQQYATLLVQQSLYVAGLGDVLFKGDGISNVQAVGKGELWFNKSITPFYQAGLASADSNGLYEWQLGRTEKHCATCLTMNGQKHRLKSYISKGILPQSDQLDCGGWNCDCKLTKTSGSAEGEWA